MMRLSEHPYYRWYRRLWRWTMWNVLRLPSKRKLTRAEIEAAVRSFTVADIEAAVEKAKSTPGAVMKPEPIECPGCGATINAYGLPIPPWAGPPPFECAECGAEIR